MNIALRSRFEFLNTSLVSQETIEICFATRCFICYTNIEKDDEVLLKEAILSIGLVKCYLVVSSLVFFVLEYFNVYLWQVAECMLYNFLFSIAIGMY